MPDTTLTINHADGGSETYTINRDKFEGVRTMETIPQVLPISGLSEGNGDYKRVEDYNGKPSWRINGNGATPYGLFYFNQVGATWMIARLSDNTVIASTSDTVDEPWEATSWSINTPVIDASARILSVDRSKPDDIRNLLIDAQNVTIDRDKGGEIRTLFIDGVEVTIDRTGEVVVKRLLDLFTGAAAAYSLQSLKGTADQALINARRGSDGVEVDVYPDNTNNREVSADSPITVTSGSSTATTLGGFLTEDVTFSNDDEDGTATGWVASNFGGSSTSISNVTSGALSGSRSIEIDITSGSTSNGYPRVRRSTAGNLNLSAGLQYRIKCKLKLTAGVAKVYARFGSASGNTAFGSQTLVVGEVLEIDETFTPSSIGGSVDNIEFIFDGTLGTGTILIDDLELTALNHDAFVTTWYDQSGNNNDAAQTLDDAQPKIAEGGSVLADGLDFDGSDDFLQTESNFDAFGANSLSFFTVFNPSDLSGNPRFLNTRVGTAGVEFIANDTSARLYYKDSAGNGTNGNNQNAGLSADTEVLYTNIVDRDTDQDLEAFKNGSSLTISNPTDLTGVGSVNAAKLTIGANQSGIQPYNGKTKEIIIYNSDQSDNRADIEANINGRYSIY